MAYYIIKINLVDSSTFETNLIAPNVDEAVEIAMHRLQFHTGNRYANTHVDIDVKEYKNE